MKEEIANMEMSGDEDYVLDPPLNSLDCWDYSIDLEFLSDPKIDLHLAAELGKTLLERNKDLENTIKLQQCTIDDQAQEIEYMKKQTAALREVNDSRLKIYEQLEVSIQDLERANHRLALENANDKKQIKSQCLTIDSLESRVDDLQKKFDELYTKHEHLLREQQQNTKSSDEVDSAPSSEIQISRDGSKQIMAVSPRRTRTEEESRGQQSSVLVTDQDVSKLAQQLKDAQYQRAREQKKVEELREQLDALLQEHAQMEEQLVVWKAKAQDIKNLQDEINTLEEVRHGHLCGRCLRGTDGRTNDNLSVMLDQEEDDEISLAESFADSIRDADTTLQEFSRKNELLEEDNFRESYRVLVEKYEALLKAQQNLAQKRKASNGLSLQEELQMSGEFNSNRDSGAGSSCCAKGSVGKPFAGTPTDFSEAETSSSGFADETSNKATQTEGRPGSLICSIADGDDCKLSIYDDSSSSFESRFHKTPEYRKIFSEIFEVLKRAAEAKDETTAGSGLLLDEADSAASNGGFLLGAEDAPSEMTDDTRSIVSLAVSSVASEPVFRVHSPLFARREKPAQQQQPQDNQSPAQQESQQQPQQQQQQQNGRSAEPRQIHNNTRHQPLEYLSVQVRKRGTGKKSRRSVDGTPGTPQGELVAPSPNPRVRELKAGSARRNKFRPLTASEISDGFVWNGTTTHFYPSKSPRNQHRYQSHHQHPQQQQQHQQQQQSPGSSSRNNWEYAAPSQEYKPGSASEDFARLRRLEMSYAEALRTPNNKTNRSGRQRRHH